MEHIYNIISTAPVPPPPLSIFLLQYLFPIVTYFFIYVHYVARYTFIVIHMCIGLGITTTVHVYYAIIAIICYSY